VKYYIKENSLFARIAAWELKQDKMAMVLGKTILLHNTSKKEFISNKKWLRHELVHVKQFQQHGYIVFLLKYITESINKGYYNNKFEKEAREGEDDETLDE